MDSDLNTVPWLAFTSTSVLSWNDTLGLWAESYRGLMGE